MSDTDIQTCPAPIRRHLPWKPFSPEPLKDPARELLHADDVPALRATMEYLENAIAEAAGTVVSARGESLAKAAGGFEALLDFHQFITAAVKPATAAPV